MNTRAKAESVSQTTAMLDPILWKNLQTAENTPIFCQSWLQLQSALIYGVISGIVLWKDTPETPYAPVAFYPYKIEDYRRYKKTAETVIREKKGVVIRSTGEGSPDDPANFQLGYPVLADGEVNAIALVEISPRDNLSLQMDMRTLQWGVVWLENYVRKTRFNLQAASDSHLQGALGLAAQALQQNTFKTAATVTATELADYFNCHRVSIGFQKRKRSKLVSISHSAFFGKQMNLVRRLEAAMDESIDQKSAIWLPEPTLDLNRVTRVHEDLMKAENSGAVCTVPMLDASENAYGAVTFERYENQPFDADAVAACDSVVALIGPILREKQKNDQWLIVKIFHTIEDHCRKFIGPGHLSLKLGGVVALMLVLFFSFAKGDYRVTAKTELEGEIQRAVVSPFNGYIEKAEFRAGDLVKAGQALCILDDKDLRLERLDAVSRREQYVREMRKAMADNERAQVNILQQQIAQADARVELLGGQLERAAIKAPFDGLVVTGDLSQTLGAPVEKGEVLFEIAPLDAYRVILEVEEADIRALKAGQSGSLILTSLPYRKFEIRVEKITPVTAAKEGRSFFTVEASLKDVSEELRPGMEGYSKIFIDRRRLVWIWTHDMIQWFRLKLWYLLP